MNLLLEKPQIGDIRKGRDIGKKSDNHGNYIWYTCRRCNEKRWVCFQKGKATRELCRPCSAIESGPRRSLLKGTNSPAWKGGRHTTISGYIRIYMPEHPRAVQKYVFEHMFVWERVHNKSLPKGWLIHHLNGVKDDNRPENLIAMPKKQHLHQAEPYKKRIRALEMKIELLEKALQNSQLIYKLEEN